jgi:hypothetical protein
MEMAMETNSSSTPVRRYISNTYLSEKNKVQVALIAAASM